MELIFRVAGTPRPQPRHRHRIVLGGNTGPWHSCPHCAGQFRATSVLYVEDARVAAWKQDVQYTFQYASRHQGGTWPATGPLSVLITVFTPRAQKGPKTRQWDSRRGHPSGDVDNFAKAIMDALNGVAWADDGQVSSLTIDKVIIADGESCCAEVEIETLEQPHPSAIGFVTQGT